MNMIIEIAGWLGAGFSLYAFFLVSFNKSQGNSNLYQYLNAIAAVLLIINTFAHKAYPSMFINIVWVAISVSSMLHKNRELSQAKKAYSKV